MMKEVAVVAPPAILWDLISHSSLWEQSGLFQINQNILRANDLFA